MSAKGKDKNRTAAGKLYFLRRADGLIKIGYTSNFQSRLGALTKAHGPLEVLRVINGDKKRERRLHHQFAKLNQFGEWFRDDGSLVPAIMALPEGDVVSIEASETKRRWIEGERKLAAEAAAFARDLILTRSSRFGIPQYQAIEQLTRELGFTGWAFSDIAKGRTQTISAYAFMVIKEALPQELLALRDELLAQAEAIERANAR